jgi:hypothetical protein
MTVFQITPYDMKRLELYCNNMADYHLVTDLLPSLARLYFLFGLSQEVHLSALQQAILLGLGLQVWPLLTRISSTWLMMRQRAILNFTPGPQGLISPLGVKLAPRGKISPLGVKFTPLFTPIGVNTIV